jgi:hypothetical protein
MSAVAWSNYSVGNDSQVGEDDSPSPACVSCKQRKLRCSRELPACSHCLRLCECLKSELFWVDANLWHSFRMRVPAKEQTGSEARSRRGVNSSRGYDDHSFAITIFSPQVAFLENILLDENGNIRLRYQHDDGRDVTHQRIHAGTEDAPDVEISAQRAEPNLDHYRLNAPGEIPSNPQEKENTTSKSLKRRLEMPAAESWFCAFEDVDIAQHLPPRPLLEKVADFFCVSFHHWIPYIHKQRLQTRVRQGAHEPGLDLVLHALVAVALRHMDPNVLFLDSDQVHQQTRISRMIVETRALHDVTIESLQALVFLVFDLLNDGQTQRAWPLIGSLTRTIDYLQLTTELSTSQSGSLMTPVRLVRPSNDWTELEERRRLFWIIFLLDRFCSVSTGWNTSLTADDVHRRLPADGGYFTREEPVTTPYFGK